MSDLDMARIDHILENRELNIFAKVDKLADLIDSLDRGMLPRILAELLVRVHSLESGRRR